MLLLVTAMNRVVQSNYKNIDVVGLNSSGKKLILNLRVEYNNGCVINLTLSQEKIPGHCEIIDQNGSRNFEFQTPLYLSYPYLNQEYTAISNFVRHIQCEDKKANSFDNLLNGVQIVHDIREHLRFNGIVF